ncbi:hypothetical protein B0H17DRAFT_1219898 [Mycena rosella]|uniref:Uncharacterized protein n=1 Tax=Mycena rosella TaxID=1033263 RepID=A0AAD7BEY2_MYCRO|nr:hypothetical protein B0H17DRAFT_1219898 [Mycena rosella]
MSHISWGMHSTPDAPAGSLHDTLAPSSASVSFPSSSNHPPRQEVLVVFYPVLRTARPPLCRVRDPLLHTVHLISAAVRHPARSDKLPSLHAESRLASHLLNFTSQLGYTSSFGAACTTMHPHGDSARVIMECQKYTDYQALVRCLLTAVDAWAAPLVQDPVLRSALALLRTLLKRFVGASLDPLLPAAHVLAVDRDTGHVFYHEKYLVHNAVVGSRVDALNTALTEDLARFTRDFLFDGEGTYSSRRGCGRMGRGYILPKLVGKVRRGHPHSSTNDAFNLVMENLSLIFISDKGGAD